MVVEPQWCIYGLKVRGTEVYRYIGITTVGLQKRFSDHLYTSNFQSTPKALWMKENLNQIVCEVIETCSNDRVLLAEREKFWIDHYRKKYGRFDSDGENKCLNVSDGGSGVIGYHHTTESRLKMSDSLRGRKFSEDHKAKISKALRGKNTWTKGNPYWDGTRGHTEESKKKISSSSSGINNSQYGLKGTLSPNFGKTPTKETIAKRNATRARSAESKVTCPHCYKVGVAGGQMTRWHFDNCKHYISPS